MRRAVVDVGSNSVLLLVAERAETGWRTLLETSEVTGLGTGTQQTRRLRADAQERTLAAVRRAFETAAEHGAPCVAAGTMALRIAENAGAFQQVAERQGTPVETISGDEEAQLGLAAVMDDPAFADHVRVSVVDPGGHSTELTTAERAGPGYEVLFRRSFPVGALGLLEGPMADESPGLGARLSAVELIDDSIGLQYLPAQAGTAVALGATPTNLVAMRERLEDWDAERVHGQYLDFEEVSKAVGSLCDMTELERAALVGLESGRERTIHIGALILERFLQSLHVLGCAVSTRGWRHALLERDI